MNYVDAKKSITLTLRAALWAFGLGGALILGAFCGAWDVAFFGFALAVALPIVMCSLWAFPLWERVEKTRAAGRICPLAVLLVPSISAVPAIVFPYYRPPRLILG